MVQIKTHLKHRWNQIIQIEDTSIEFKEDGTSEIEQEVFDKISSSLEGSEIFVESSSSTNIKTKGDDDDDDFIVSEFDAFTKAELQEMLKTAGVDESEWKTLNKAKLILLVEEKVK